MLPSMMKLKDKISSERDHLLVVMSLWLSGTGSHDLLLDGMNSVYHGKLTIMNMNSCCSLYVNYFEAGSMHRISGCA